MSSKVGTFFSAHPRSFQNYLQQRVNSWPHHGTRVVSLDERENHQIDENTFFEKLFAIYYYCY